MIHVVSLLFASKSCKQVTGNAKGNGGIAHPLPHYSVCGSVREINNWSSYRRWSRTTDRLRWLPAAAAHHRTNTVVPSFLLLCIMMRRPSDRPSAIKKRWEMHSWSPVLLLPISSPYPPTRLERKNGIRRSSIRWQIRFGESGEPRRIPQSHW